MSGFLLFSLTFLAGAIIFYKTNALLSLVCLLVFIGCAYSQGKLG